MANYFPTKLAISASFYLLLSFGVLFPTLRELQIKQYPASSSHENQCRSTQNI